METAGKQIYGKKIPLKGFFLILFIFNTFSITSQIISGEIKNEKIEKIEKIEYVNIGIVGTNKGTISDNNGFFSIDISKYSTLDSLYFSHLSYELKKKINTRCSNRKSIHIKAKKYRTSRSCIT